MGWKTKTLGEICTIARGGSPRPIKSFLTDDDNGVNWIKIGDATASVKYIYKTKEKIKPEGIKKSRLVHEGDFLLSNSMSFGRPYIMKTSGCIHDGWLVLSDKLGLFEQDYLYYFLSSNAAYKQFDSRAAGSTVRNLNIDLVRSVQILLPPLQEQKLIIGILDKAFEGIDKAIANTEKNLTNARELFESYLNNIFTQKDADWVESKFETVMEIKHGFAFKGTDFKKSEDVLEPIVLTPGNYTEEGTLSFTKRNTKRLSSYPPKDFIFDLGDLTIVMTDLSSKMKILGKPAFINQPNILHNQRIGRIRFFGNDVDPRFVYYTLRTSRVINHIKQTSTGTMVRHTAPKRILSLSFSYPKSLEKQLSIIENLDIIEMKYQTIHTAFLQKLISLKELKQSLLQKAFAGELTNQPEEKLSDSA